MTADNEPNVLDALGDYVGARSGRTADNPPLVKGVGSSGRKPYSGRPHQSHCSCFYELNSLRDEAADWKAGSAEEARQGDEARAEVEKMAEEAANWRQTALEAQAEVERLRAALREYVTGCYACLGTGQQPRPGNPPCTECAPARRALDKQKANLAMTNDETFQAAVAAELVRARGKFPSSNLVLAALTEEVGELAQAMLKVRAGKWPKEQLVLGGVFTCLPTIKTGRSCQPMSRC